MDGLDFLDLVSIDPHLSKIILQISAYVDRNAIPWWCLFHRWFLGISALLFFCSEYKAVNFLLS
jgi:hypothetical protein